MEVKQSSFLSLQHQPQCRDSSRRLSSLSFYGLILILVVIMVAVPPYFFSTIATVLQAANLSRITTGAISEALGPISRPTSNSTFASVAGPVIQRNFPDPSAIKVGDIWHAFATNNNNDGQVQVATSMDFESWTYLNINALPDAGPWSTGKAVWAPDVVQLVCHRHP